MKKKSSAPYRMSDDSVTVRGKGHPEYSGKSITPRGEEQVRRRGHEPGRYVTGAEQQAGRSTARDVTSVRPLDPVLPEKMPNLR